MNHWEKIAHVKKLALIERVAFYSVKEEGGCWRWIGSVMSASPANQGGFGYGRIGFGKRNWLAHRFSWMAHNGEIPKGMSVLHKCDNPRCVNPEHLILGTQLENIADRNRKGRQTKKLSDEQVREIREAVGFHKEIAAKYGVTRTAVTQIKLKLRRAAA